MNLNVKHKIKAQKGRILISDPFMGDPNFERTVVYLCEHTEEGSLGFVLNKPIEGVTLNELFYDIEDDNFNIFLGGPVEQDILQFVHNLGDKLEGSIQVAEGVYFGGNFEQLKDLLEKGELDNTNIKFFLGYSGWAEGQLEEELSNDAWIVSRVKSRDIFTKDPSHLWRNILKEKGGVFKMLSNTPLDPRMN